MWNAAEFGRQIEHRPLRRLETLLRWMDAIDLNPDMRALLSESIDDLRDMTLRLLAGEVPPDRTMSGPVLFRGMADPDEADDRLEDALSDEELEEAGQTRVRLELSGVDAGDVGDVTGGGGEGGLGSPALSPTERVQGERSGTGWRIAPYIVDPDEELEDDDSCFEEFDEEELSLFGGRRRDDELASRAGGDTSIRTAGLEGGGERRHAPGTTSRRMYPAEDTGSALPRLVEEACEEIEVLRHPVAARAVLEPPFRVDPRAAAVAGFEGLQLAAGDEDDDEDGSVSTFVEEGEAAAPEGPLSGLSGSMLFMMDLEQRLPECFQEEVDLVSMVEDEVLRLWDQ